MKKFLHIFPYEKFTDDFVYFINRNFDVKEHIFWIYGEKSSLKLTCINESNVVYMPWKALGRSNVLGHLKYKKMVQEADKIILHGFWLGYPWLKRIRKEFINEKVHICFWGGDIYHSYNEYDKKDVYLKNFIKKARGIIALTEGDYYLIKEKYDAEGIYLAGQYPEKPQIQKYMNTKRENGNTKIIMLGNSATKTNCHMEMIDKLAKYQNEDIKIIVPLSYGDKNYGEEVRKYGEKIFGDKFIALEKFMEPEEYGKILSDIDIGIFYNNRQQAMGNINSLIAMKAKIYLRPETTMWYRYKEEIGCKVYNGDYIGEIPFQEFTNIEMSDLEQNYKAYLEYFNENNLVDKWKKIFES